MKIKNKDSLEQGSEALAENLYYNAAKPRGVEPILAPGPLAAGFRYVANKILKILPFWLIFLFLCVIIQVFLPILRYQGVNKTFSDVTAPKVLGTSITVNASIRGEAVEEKKFVETAKINFSDITAKSFLVFDLKTSQNLLSKNNTQKLSIASLTKLLTALTAYEEINLNNSFILPKSYSNLSNPILNLKMNDEVKSLDIFNAMLVGSCNDAALALADYVSSSTGSSFVSLMNSRAQSLGMFNSHFSNPMGFDSQYNYSTADDLKILISATEKLAAFTNLGRQTGYKFVSLKGQAYSTTATNKLLKTYPEIISIKTGHTSEAQGAMAVKTNIQGRDIVILVLGSQDREKDILSIKTKIIQGFTLE